MITEYVPYVYILKNKTTGLKYLGVKYAKGCNPKDFWITYFTSSKLVGKLIEEYGVEDWVFKIIHRFLNDPEAAIIKEASYFPFIKKREDYLNMCFGYGIQDLRVASKAGKVGGAIVKSRKIGILKENNEEQRKKWASMGGKVGGKKQAELGLGFHKYKTDPELHRKWSSTGGKKGCLVNGWKDPIQQAERGRKGGSKNKGFAWLSDGVINIKYSKKMQAEKSIDDFLSENKTFSRGRTIKWLK